MYLTNDIEQAPEGIAENLLAGINFVLGIVTCGISTSVCAIITGINGVVSLSLGGVSDYLK